MLQTLHSCCEHMEDVHVTFWKCVDIFRKNFHEIELKSFLAGLHKVHRAYRMVNAGWASLIGYLRGSLKKYVDICHNLFDVIL
jgi:hypothetical protein